MIKAITLRFLADNGEVLPEPFTDAERKLWLSWIVAAVAGPALATTLVQLITGRFPSIINEEFFFILPIGLAIPKALLQWWALRSHISRQNWLWLVASVAGGFVSTLAIGVAQWLVLRRWVQRAFWWPIAGYLLWYLGTLYVAQISGNEIALIPLWLVNGSVAGWLMIILLRRPLGPEDGNEFDALIRKMEERQNAKGTNDG